MTPSRRFNTWPVLVIAALVAGPVAAQAPSTNLLVLDIDAEPILDSGNQIITAGALFNVDLGAATDAAPVVAASAPLGAPFKLVAGVALSPVDGHAYVADVGVDVGDLPKILSIGADGSVDTIWSGPPLVSPNGLDVMPDGRLLIADMEADPSGLGAAANCGVGHGAIFILDPAACPSCAPQLLADGSNHPFSPIFPSVFGDPIDVAYDPGSGLVYVADLCGSPLNYSGSVYTVDPADGRVALVSSMPEYVYLVGLALRPAAGGGTDVLVVDAGLDTDQSVVWKVDPSNPDPETNGTRLSFGTQYSQLQGITVDATGKIFVVDWGEYDDASQSFIEPPAVFSIDESIPTPTTNAVLVNDTTLFVTPIAACIVPVPTVTRIVPSAIAGPASITIEGTSLSPGMTIDFGPDIAVGTVDYAPGVPVGTALQVLVTPLGGGIVPQGCSAPTFDLTITQPFGGTTTMTAALAASGGTGGITPLPPASTRGDATGDGFVDGMDLAILGQHFGRSYCDGLVFENDADFNNDDIIDGMDLDILASYFGTTP
jgi:sugar lactone lactonase YvrE